MIPNLRILLLAVLLILLALLSTTVTRHVKWSEFHLTSVTTKADATSSTLTTTRFEDIVLVGHFNYDTPVEFVSHWVRRWSDVFRRVDVRGPFNSSTNLEAIQQAGINVFLAQEDWGFFSPIKTIAESLRLYANDPTIRGVVMIHDDLLLNISHLVALGFPSAESIVTAVSPDVLSSPYITFHGNATFSLVGNSSSWPTSQISRILPWAWWGRNSRRMVAAARGSENGSLTLYGPALSDFLYVPISMVKEFVPLAEWMVNNAIFLEIATTTILGRLKNHRNATIISTKTCTKYGKFKSRTMLWVPSCLVNWTGFGLYHPVKMRRIGVKKWDVMFDAIVLGRKEQLFQDLECLLANRTTVDSNTDVCRWY